MSGVKRKHTDTNGLVDPASLANTECMLHILSFLCGLSPKEAARKKILSIPLREAGKLYHQLSSISWIWKDIVDTAFCSLVPPVDVLLSDTEALPHIVHWLCRHQLSLYCIQIPHLQSSHRPLITKLLRQCDTTELTYFYEDRDEWEGARERATEVDLETVLAKQCPKLKTLHLTLSLNMDGENVVSPALFSKSTIERLTIKPLLCNSIASVFGAQLGPEFWNSLLGNLTALESLTIDGSHLRGLVGTEFVVSSLSLKHLHGTNLFPSHLLVNADGCPNLQSSNGIPRLQHQGLSALRAEQQARLQRERTEQQAWLQLQRAQEEARQQPVVVARVGERA